MVHLASKWPDIVIFLKSGKSASCTREIPMVRRQALLLESAQWVRQVGSKTYLTNFSELANIHLRLLMPHSEQTDSFDYTLPPERIAQAPVRPRDAAKLLHLDRSSGALADQVFHELPGLLRPGDLLVMNDTRVIKARLRGIRETTGGKIELLLLHPDRDSRWMAWTKSGGRLRAGERLILADGAVTATVVERRGAFGDVVELEHPDGLAVEQIMQRYGHVPLPPYISRETLPEDAENYQTIYASKPGAVAAPTAGLHFTETLLDDLARAGIDRTHITLHVGPGTFRPVKAARLRNHEILPERCVISAEAARKIQQAKDQARRVVAVGTTVTRALESAARKHDGHVVADAAWTDLFIHPPFKFQIVDALITNFHLPKSTLLMLVSAFASREQIFAAYRHALAGDYRFFSYGDAMLIE